MIIRDIASSPISSESTRIAAIAAVLGKRIHANYEFLYAWTGKECINCSERQITLAFIDRCPVSHTHMQPREGTTCSRPAAHTSKFFLCAYIKEEKNININTTHEDLRCMSK